MLQIPGGILADRFGPRPIMAFGIAWWSIFTALTAVAKSLNPMILIRVAFGLGEGVFPPAAFKTISAWFPKKEVGRANGFMLTTNSLGPALAPLFVTGIVATWGWRSVFVSLFFPGIIIAALVWFFVANTAGQIAGFISPLLVGYILSQTDNNYTVVFNLFVGCLVIASVLSTRIKRQSA